MILVDASVWIDHFRSGDAELGALLEENGVAIHDLVIEELACGRLAARASVLGHLRRLPRVETVRHEELLAYVETHRLAGSGLGCVDAHLLASAALSGARLLTHDEALRRAAAKLGLLRPAPFH